MSEKCYFISLSLKNRLRVWIEIEKGSVIDFLVQLEHKTDDAWKQVVRYNYAHGFPHRDLILSNGTKEKEGINETELGKVVIFATKDIKDNWEDYVREAGYEERQRKGNDE